MKKVILFVFGLASMVGLLSVLPMVAPEIPISKSTEATIVVEQVETKLPEVLADEELEALKSEIDRMEAAEKAVVNTDSEIVPIKVYIKDVTGDRGRSSASLNKDKPLSARDQMILEMMGEGDMASADEVDQDWNDDNLHLDSEMTDEWGQVQ